MIGVFAYPHNGYISRSKITQNLQWINKVKVCISYAYGERGEFPYLVLGKPFIAEKGTCCTETYLVIDILENENQAKNLIKYMKTNFFRFMMSLVKNTQNITKGVFVFVPKLNMDEEWTDEKLYKKYKLKQDEIDFIATIVKKMVSSDE